MPFFGDDDDDSSSNSKTKSIKNNFFSGFSSMTSKISDMTESVGGVVARGMRGATVGTDVDTEQLIASTNPTPSPMVTMNDGSSGNSEVTSTIPSKSLTLKQAMGIKARLSQRRTNLTKSDNNISGNEKDKESINSPLTSSITQPRTQSSAQSSVGVPVGRPTSSSSLTLLTRTPSSVTVLDTSTSQNARARLEALRAKRGKVAAGLPITSPSTNATKTNNNTNTNMNNNNNNNSSPSNEDNKSPNVVESQNDNKESGDAISNNKGLPATDMPFHIITQSVDHVPVNSITSTILSSSDTRGDGYLTERQSIASDDEGKIHSPLSRRDRDLNGLSDDAIMDTLLHTYVKSTEINNTEEVEQQLELMPINPESFTSLSMLPSSYQQTINNTREFITSLGAAATDTPSVKVALAYEAALSHTITLMNKYKQKNKKLVTEKNDLIDILNDYDKTIKKKEIKEAQVQARVEELEASLLDATTMVAELTTELDSATIDKKNLKHNLHDAAEAVEKFELQASLSMKKSNIAAIIGARLHGLTLKGLARSFHYWKSSTIAAIINRHGTTNTSHIKKRNYNDDIIIAYTNKIQDDSKWGRSCASVALMSNIFDKYYYKSYLNSFYAWYLIVKRNKIKFLRDMSSRLTEDRTMYKTQSEKYEKELLAINRGTSRAYLNNAVGVGNLDVDDPFEDEFVVNDHDDFSVGG